MLVSDDLMRCVGRVPQLCCRRRHREQLGDEAVALRDGLARYPVTALKMNTGRRLAAYLSHDSDYPKR
jgi:hypothetical protein